MRAETIELTDTAAVVQMTPSWLGRLLGAKVTRLELRKYADGSWHAKVTGRDIEYMWHTSAIRYALDFRPVHEQPRATAKEKARP